MAALMELTLNQTIYSILVVSKSSQIDPRILGFELEGNLEAMKPNDIFSQMRKLKHRKTLNDFSRAVQLARV